MLIPCTQRPPPLARKLVRIAARMLCLRGGWRSHGPNSLNLNTQVGLHTLQPWGPSVESKSDEGSRGHTPNTTPVVCMYLPQCSGYVSLNVEKCVNAAALPLLHRASACSKDPHF